MVILNRTSRDHLATEAIRRSPRMSERAPALIEQCNAAIADAMAYSKEHVEDVAAISGWTWTGP